MSLSQGYYGDDDRSRLSPTPNYKGVCGDKPQLSPVSTYSTSSSGSGQSQRSIKSGNDIRRDQLSENKALTLLDEAIGGVGTRKKPRDGGYQARQEAIRRYEQKRREQPLKPKMGPSKQFHSQAVPVIVTQKRKEKQAESTRAPKPKVEKNAYDTETVEGMKCQWDLDREKAAKARALRLLNEGFMF